MYFKIMTMKKILLLVTITLIVSCTKEDITHNYYYEVSGSANNYDVTIEAAPSGTSQYTNVGSGWKYSWTQTGEGTRFLYLSAQNNNSSGTVIVKIVKDGGILATNTSSGAYVIASVDGSY
jgi:hypothetical protein